MSACARDLLAVHECIGQVLATELDQELAQAAIAMTPRVHVDCFRAERVMMILAKHMFRKTKDPSRMMIYI